MDSAYNNSDGRMVLSRLYYSALQKYLKQGPGSDMESARELGRHAMEIGMETLDMARIHEVALVSLVLPSYSANTNTTLMGRAGLFFAEALTPIEQTHRGALEANANLKQLVKDLSQRTEDLAGSVAGLKQEILQRQAVEESLRVSEQTSKRDLEHSRQMEDELRHLSRQLLSAQEEERRKISRELHDVIAQTLTSINMRLSVLKVDAASAPKRLEKDIASTQRQVEKSIDIVHRFARELRPTVLDDLGLIPALQVFLKEFIASHGIRASLTVFAGVEQATSTVRTALYRVAQEAMANVARHAHASQVEVSIRDGDGLIVMEISDNGQGFAVNGQTSVRKHNRLGLLGMRERVEMLGGTFAIISAPGQSTTIRVAIPGTSGGTDLLPARASTPITVPEDSVLS